MKHLLYFAGYKMVVLRWHANAFTGIAEFEPQDKGFAAFARLLRDEIENPVKLLVDIIEEDFRFDRAPHIIGKDRSSLHRRLVQKYFRTNIHTYLEVQGRDQSGRRDDIVLLSSLTNSKLFEPWLKILQSNKIALEGIYSLPLVGEGLLKPLNATGRNVLLISQQVPSSIRQSFYLRGKLKLSRLAPSEEDIASQIDVIREETERTVRYLENQQYVDTENRIDVYVIVPGTSQQAFETGLKGDTRKQFHILDKDRLAFDLSIKSITPSPYSYWLFAQLLLADKHKKQHYATKEDRKYYFHHVARKAMYVGAGAILSLSIVWGAALFIGGVVMASHRQETMQETTQYERQYEEIIGDISKLNLNVNDVRSVVDIAEDIQKQYGASPVNYLQRISKSLNRHPKIRIDNIKWVKTEDTGHSFGETKKSLDRRMLRLIQMGRKSMSYEKALVEAYVTDFNDNPRIAIEEVNRFINTLEKYYQDGRIEVIKMPFDVDPSSRTVGEGLGGSSTKRDRAANFAFVLVKETER